MICNCIHGVKILSSKINKLKGQKTVVIAVKRLFY
jgi:ribosomal protein S17